jgi:hypothetical protein
MLRPYIDEPAERAPVGALLRVRAVERPSPPSPLSPRERGNRWRWTARWNGGGMFQGCYDTAD